MRNSILCVLSIMLALHANSQVPGNAFNQQLADSLGADDHGMKKYILVILKTGTAVIEKKEAVDSLFAGHMANMGKMASAGKLVVAGPMLKNAMNYRGIFILNVNSIEEATKLLQTDPAIKAKLLDSELFEWYGSAALPMYLPFHEKVQKNKF